MQKIFFMHISKSAGSSLKMAIANAFSELQCSNAVFEDEVRVAMKSSSYNMFAAHSGYKLASQHGGDVITVLRNPIDRLNSLYNFWHNRAPDIDPAGTFSLVSGMSPFEFLSSDEKRIVVDRDNSLTYQMASSHLMHGRESLASYTDADILQMAKNNLMRCKIVGFVEHLGLLKKKFKDVYSRDLKIPRKNISQYSHSPFVFDSNLRSKLYSCVYLDLELYLFAINQFLK